VPIFRYQTRSLTTLAEKIFYKALAMFPHKRIYANAYVLFSTCLSHVPTFFRRVNDITVPYVTAAIEVNDPFMDHYTNGIEIELDEEYIPIIKSYTLPPHPPVPTPKPTVLSPSWFKTLGPPPLPPVLQFRFPFNIVR
jgi:hypothetical protein